MIEEDPLRRLLRCWFYMGNTKNKKKSFFTKGCRKEEGVKTKEGCEALCCVE